MNIFKNKVQPEPTKIEKVFNCAKEHKTELGILSAGATVGILFANRKKIASIFMKDEKDESEESQELFTEEDIDNLSEQEILEILSEEVLNIFGELFEHISDEESNWSDEVNRLTHKLAVEIIKLAYDFDDEDAEIVLRQINGGLSPEAEMAKSSEEESTEGK